MSDRNNQDGYVLLVTCRVILLLWILVLLVFFSSRWRTRFDMTSDRLYTLTPSTQKVLASLDDKVVIEAYLTPDDKLPEVAREFRRTMRNTFDEYAQLAKGKLEIEYLDPANDVTLKERAERLGIKAQTVQESGGRAFSVLEIWQGLRIRYGGAKQKVIPFVNFFALTTQYEALLTPPIKELSIKTKPKIGVLAFATESGGGGMNPFQRQQQSQPQGFNRIREVVKGRYELTDIDLNEGRLVPDDVKTLFLIRPKNLSDRQKYALDQFLMGGNKLVVFCDTAEFEIGRSRALTSTPISYDAADAKLKFIEQLGCYGINTDDRVVSDMLQDVQEPYVFPVTGFGGTFGQRLPSYPYWFKALDQDWAEKRVVELFARDVTTGEVNQENVKKYLALFKRGLDPSNSFIQALAKGMQGRGPSFFWPCRVERADKTPDGVDGATLMRTSPGALIGAPPQSANPFGGAMKEVEKQREYQKFLREFDQRFMSEPRTQYGLMAALKGTFPSYFDGKQIPPRKKPEAPKPADPLSEPIKSSPVTDSQPTPDSQPTSQPSSQPESKPDLQGPAIPGANKEADKDKDPPFVAKAPASAQLIVVGDSDFIRDDLVGGEYSQEGGPVSGQPAARFLSGLLDWLSEDSDLLELTNKKVAERVLSYGKALSISSDKEADEFSQGQQRTATRLRFLVVAGPVLLILLIWVLATLKRRARKEQFLASVGGR